ncbi:multidrug resistance-associated ABC transporter [Rhizoctonia solani AG-1 IA]|uniref:Multidrug resistance-associated ABC transporter n=1 Tax=Thanatephorus cucumeris (strain AG1-IA) TaxID=983506 RepID=L8X420_THACA|nr:multidrug resistance-associated ABC transporter [Rhizoctonia solani AG-1 IA]
MAQHAPSGALAVDEKSVPGYEEPYPWWCRVPFVSLKPKAPPDSLETATTLPEDHAPWFSRLTFWWLNPLLSQGYSRPLQATDMYQLGDKRGAHVYSSRLQDAFERRRTALEDFKARIENLQARPSSWRRFIWRLSGSQTVKEEQWRKLMAKRQPSLAGALNDTIFWWFWIGGLYKGLADAGTICSPLLVKALINFASQSYAAHSEGTAAPSIGKGLGLAFGLLALQWLIMLLNVHAFHRSFTTGVLLRTALITSVFSRALSLTSRARTMGGMTAGKFVGLISTDVSRIDYCAGYFHMAWTAPLQMAICLIILCINLGWSALPGLAFFVILSPLQGKVTQRLFLLRMVWTEKRIKALHEILGAMRIIKLFAWELPFMDRIGEYRRSEMSYLRSRLTLRSFNNAFAFSLPTLASVVSFVIYSASGHTLEPGIIFSSLSLFVLLRTPMTFLPVALNAITDASAAVQRLQPIFMAETRSESLPVELDLPVAIKVQALDLTWDLPPPTSAPKKRAGTPQRNLLGRLRGRFGAKPTAAPVSTNEKPNTTPVKEPFKMNNINLEIPRGQLCAIVGPVGSGKSSMLQGLIGEMRKTGGEIRFGGTVGYCPQTAWIQQAADSLRSRYLRDFFRHGDLTEVGEKGISLSGGQKQRINIARALYFGCDITLFDDSFSALDAHVGKAVFDNVVRAGGALDGRTRVLVTHKLDFLPHVDYIITLSEGKITEQGTYAELMAADGFFAKFISEFSHNSAEETNGSLEHQNEQKKTTKKTKASPGGKAAMMQNEERATGSVSWKGKSFVLLCSPPLFEYRTLKGHIADSQSNKMAIYAILGFAQDALDHVDTIDNVIGDACRMFIGTLVQIIGAVVLISVVQPWFLLAVAIVLLAYYWIALYYRASAREVKRLDAVLRSSLYAHFGEAIGGISTIHAYQVSSQFKLENERRMDLENRAYWITTVNQRWLSLRLDFLGSLLLLAVSLLCVGARFTISPAQTGVVVSYMLTIQASFGWAVRQSAEVENNMNGVERIVYYAREVEQEASHDSNPSEPGSSAWPITGQIELRDAIVRYRPELPPVLNGLSLSVRGGEHVGIVGRTGAGKSTAFLVTQALFRMMELSSGAILIDGVDISKLGLRKLRSALTSRFTLESSLAFLISENPQLYLRILFFLVARYVSTYDDARLWDALKRAHLVEPSKSNSSIEKTSGNDLYSGRFTLDMEIQDEGSNLSVGEVRETATPHLQMLSSLFQRSLVSLARALVRDTRIVLMDEATASVDYKTDRNIQLTIQEEFRNKTLLCIAHRLQTIIGYDKICVVDGGRVAEFDSPTRLFENKDSIFYGMCKSSGITSEDIKNATR